MPQQKTRSRARADKRAGKSASTQAGEYVKEKIHKLKRGQGNAKSRKQAIAIGLSEARRDGVKVKPEPRSKRQATRPKSRSTKSKKR